MNRWHKRRVSSGMVDWSSFQRIRYMEWRAIRVIRPPSTVSTGSSVARAIRRCRYCSHPPTSLMNSWSRPAVSTESFVGGVPARRVLADCRSPARLHVGDFGRHRRWSPRHAGHPHPQFGAVPRDSQGHWSAGRVQRQPVPATKAHRLSRRRLTRSATKSTCIWTAVPPKAMSPAPSSKPTVRARRHRDPA